MARNFAKMFLQLVLKRIFYNYFLCVGIRIYSLKRRGNSFDGNFGCHAQAKQCLDISIIRKVVKGASVHILDIFNIISLLKYLINYWLEFFPHSSSAGNNSPPIIISIKKIFFL